MDLTVITEKFGGDKASWLGSRHAVTNARTITIDRSSLTKETHYPDGYLPSGLPLAKSGDKYKPLDEGETLVGFLLTNQTVKTDGGDIVAPLLDHGRVIVKNLPVEFTAPAEAGAFIYV